MRRQLLFLLFVVPASACDRGTTVSTARGSVATAPRVVINEVMANPRATPDERGEWLEVLNLETTPVDLRGWTLASDHDRGAVVERSLQIAPNGVVVLARDGDPRANGGVAAAFAWGDRVALGNGADWVALRTAEGLTADSVSWTSTVAGASRARIVSGSGLADVAGEGWASATEAFGDGDFGTPGVPNNGAAAEVAENRREDPPARERAPASDAPPTSASRGPPRLGGADPPRDSTLTIRFLDVGQGDAILVENGGSRVLIDGGPDAGPFGRLLERLGIEGSVIDAVILTHPHSDHYGGLREIFRSRRRVGVRYFFENRDPNAAGILADLRDSIATRARRGSLEYRDTDDPCGSGAASCTITMRGGARVHVLRPDPRGDGPNNRSVAVKLVAPDSTFAVWLAGDAEQQQIRWFDRVDYDRAPGMAATVLKANHHGSCDGISPRYLDMVRPEIAVMSLAAVNDYGYVHSQTLDQLASRRIPWYRTDQNGTVTITVPRRRLSAGERPYSVTVERGGANMRGPSDRRARDCGER
jgi:competence protein ComEC